MEPLILIHMLLFQAIYEPQGLWEEELQQPHGGSLLLFWSFPTQPVWRTYSGEDRKEAMLNDILASGVLKT